MGPGRPGWSSRAIQHGTFADAFRPKLGFLTNLGSGPKYVAVPFWAIGATFLLPCVSWALGRRRRLARHRVARGLCPDCGYNLRATPGRCPECGLGFSGIHANAANCVHSPA
jgi:hypothetical protein